MLGSPSDAEDAVQQFGCVSCNRASGALGRRRTATMWRSLPRAPRAVQRAHRRDRSTADFLISSPIFTAEYAPRPTDYSGYVQRGIGGRGG
jgi:hypothetical protein